MHCHFGRLSTRPIQLKDSFLTFHPNHPHLDDSERDNFSVCDPLLFCINSCRLSLLPRRCGNAFWRMVASVPNPVDMTATEVGERSSCLNKGVVGAASAAK